MVVQMLEEDILLTFKEAMNYLRVSRSTLYRLMWSGQLTGHKVGSTWRFYRDDLRASIQAQPPVQENTISRNADQTKVLVAASQDRKSTRLNSSHMSISYAVFCLKKKK